MFTWSENPKEDVFNHLKVLTYQENSKSLVRGSFYPDRVSLFTLSPDDLEKKSLQISMCIKQGIEYFKASESVTINTSPLLIYYGILAFSKALIISLNKDIYIDNMKYHGLHTRPVNKSLQRFREDNQNWNLENEYAIVGNGVFKELNRLVSPHNMIEDNSIFKIKDCLSCIPEMANMYKKFYNETSNVLDTYMELRQNENKIEFALTNTLDQNVLLSNVCANLKIGQVAHRKVGQYQYN